MRTFLKIAALTLGAVVLLFITSFLIIRKLDNSAIDRKGFYAVSAAISTPVLLPAMFIEGERFYFKVPTGNGDTALAFGDTGGGISMLLEPSVKKLGLKPKIKTGVMKGLMPMKYVSFTDVSPNYATAGPLPLRTMILRTPFAQLEQPFLFVPAIDDELRFFSSTMACDIFFGQNFFMGKAWTIDYINRRIWVNTPLPARDGVSDHMQKLGFLKNRNGEAIFGHASMTIEVDGEVIEVLFDTGATIVLSNDGKKEFATTAKTKGASFIAGSIFDAWRKKHPEWKFYPKADLYNDVIEVPSVKVCGYDSGPVLFARRNDEVWSKEMISSMDRVVKGAIGGSVLKYFKVTIDYNSELIKFEK